MGQGKEAKYLIRRDKVKVPKNIPKGDYALSFRWIFMSSHAFAICIINLSIVHFSNKNQQVGCGGSCTSVGLLCFCKTCLTIILESDIVPFQGILKYEYLST